MGKVAEEAEVMEKLRSVVFKESESLEGACAKIEGYDFNRGVSRSQIVKSLGSTGFQASHLDDAIKIVNQMLEWRLSDEDVAENCSEEEKDLTYRESVKCKIFLGLNLNLNSAGVREYIRYLAQHRMVDVIVTTHKGIEEDIIKCLLDTYNGGYAQLDCIGKYRKLEEWIVPIFDKMLEEQNTEHVLWTPSRITARLGKEINNESSYLYFAYKNNIPVFCPALTYGSLGIGNMLHFHSIRNPGLDVNILQDNTKLRNEYVHANPRKTGMIVLGGDADMMCNGADYEVFINTFEESDGSDFGDRLDEDVSWGKIDASAKSIKVHCDATIAFPLLLVETFGAKEAKVIESLKSTVFKDSKSLEGTCAKIQGNDSNQGLNYSQILNPLGSSGSQASNLTNAIEIVNQMLEWRLSHEEVTEDCSEEERNPTYRESVRCKIFLGFTSNLISSGVRDIIRYLAQHRMVDVIVTTTGGIEEDIIKCLANTYRGDFSLPGAALRSKGLNRIGNLLVPNDNYCKFQDWIIPIFDQMFEEQKTEHALWTPSRVIARLGKEINNESSYLNWAYKNDIPVFCPALTDGSLGDMLYFHSFPNGGLFIDITQDIVAMNGEAVHANPRKTGMIFLGGGLPKHHICNANMMRNGADYAVIINTAKEFDGSDSGAHPDETVSWGKICPGAKSVKVQCDATIAFPLLVADTFAARIEKTKETKPSL